MITCTPYYIAMTFHSLLSVYHRNYMSSSTHDQSIPWISVTVWGFEDSPVSWRTNEHGWFLSGDNHCTLILFPNYGYWCMQMLATHDIIL